jgi:hypothetical protein
MITTFPDNRRRVSCAACFISFGLFFLVLFVGRTLGGDDWREWGGRDLGRNRYSSAVGLPDTFDIGEINRCRMQDPAGTQSGLMTGPVGLLMEDTQNLKWIAWLGSQSYESPTIAGGRVFVGTNNEQPRDRRHVGDRSVLMCFDEKTGSYLWQLIVPKLKSGKVNDWETLGLLSSPVVESNRLYVASTRGEVLCLTTEGLSAGNQGPFKDEAQYTAGPGSTPVPSGPKDADIVWKYDMMEELGVFPHNGTRTHPLILGDFVYVGTCNGMDWTHTNVPYPMSPSLIALDKRTGALAGVDDAHIGTNILHGQWSSPSAGQVGGRWLIFYGGGDGVCYAFDAMPIEVNGEKVLRKVWWADCKPP